MYTFHTDPGHGWLAVSREELNRLGIADKITTYSYQSQDGATVYLEEDCDYSTFAEAKKARGESVEWREQHHRHNAPCRSFGCYRRQA